ncbi:MAG TPA: CRISPR system precrRNA processing endoribonuclease RAMP protein Cas6 [Candidatus Hydrogenedentes bacterium]|nr:CRISPR system precrRNA processing endoribonuclease RAMP protein Cas6 [Candidatus Hydrogenedentota bacterium]HOL76313.1 CRISPR system precrRNA processing endoribonuclease RAMP protein Cas6 [Candidatus Hydrogenedentota bacterium]HPO86141.1 CRISPR system precrRNA processing endoribonuclease RAMP protein Cas6 [Candidatus Hydrogenedentota bacterium]
MPLERLTATEQDVCFRALESLRLPAYKGSTFRGAFGHAFKHVACALKTNVCAKCLLRHRCAYSVCFETPVPQEAEILRKYPFAPHPFVLEPPQDDRREYEPGAELQVRLYLVGKAQEYLPHFIYAFEEMGKRGLGREPGKTELVWVRSRRNGETNLIYDGNAQELVGAPMVWSAHEIATRSSTLAGIPLRLIFETPTRVKSEGRLAAAPDFATLAPSLLRRLNMLHYFFCGGEFARDIHPLLDAARGVKTLETEMRWVDWTRYSARQDATMQLGGFVGTMTISPPPENVLVYILWGELLHLGKGGAFGLGKYRIEPIE